jgi:uncharacterized protein (DUF697 family)/predicted GTPase
MTSVFHGSSWRQAWNVMRRFWKTDPNPNLDQEIAAIATQVPVPTFWLFGKTQSGKSSLVRFLTGAATAEIGEGFRPCTLTTNEYPFPNDETPLLTFLDTRGVDEPSYDPTEDLRLLDDRANLMVVTMRIRDFAHGRLREALKKIRQANRSRPVILALTCLHELDPQQQHPQPYPFDPLRVKPGHVPASEPGTVSDELARVVAEQTKQFEGLVDRVVPIDLTRPEEGYTDANYGGEMLKRVLIESLPQAYRSSFARLEALDVPLKELHLRRAMPIILGYSSVAGAAGALPIPFLDLVILPGIQARMIHAIGEVSGEPASSQRFLEIATSAGLGLIAQSAVRQVAKLIPYVGSVVGATLAGASTYALGRAFCEYQQAMQHGHVPSAETLRRIYQEQMIKAEREWFKAR